MHSLTLAQLAATIASLGKPLLAQKAILQHAASHEYWTTSRYRFDHWIRRLREHRSAIDRPGTSHRTRMWLEVMPVFEEVLLSEPLSRCLACIGAVLDARKIDPDFGPLAHSVLVSHIEIRHRCLNLIVFGHGLPVEQAVKLNRLRRHMELFSDQLLACLPSPADLDLYAFENSMVRESQSRLRLGGVEVNQMSFHVHALSISLARMLRNELDARVVSARLNSTLAQATMAMLPNRLFDSFGCGKSGTISMGQQESAESDGNTCDLSLPLQSPLDTLLKPTSTRRAKEDKSNRGRT